MNLPKPRGKEAKKVRAMLKAGVPPHKIPFDRDAVNSIYRRLSDGKKKKIQEKVQHTRAKVAKAVEVAVDARLNERPAPARS